MFKTLLIGSPLQIYRSNNTCQYSLIGLYDQMANGQYTFNNMNRKLRWIDSVVWPKKLMHISARTYQIMKKALRA